MKGICGRSACTCNLRSSACSVFSRFSFLKGNFYCVIITGGRKLVIFCWRARGKLRVVNCGGIGIRLRGLEDKASYKRDPERGSVGDRAEG